MIGWTIVVAKPNSEAIAVENLKRQGYGCYFPRYRERKPKKVLIRPLFPRYIFCHIDHHWYSIKGTRGVSNILLADEGPAFISPKIVDEIRAREDSEGYVLVGRESRQEKFIKGQPVRALEGPFAGLDLIYEGMSAQDRVKVLADILGRKVSVIVSESKLVAA
jgi:transcriptional antiterminator RfaH